MRCEPIKFEKLCGDDEKFSECGKLIREVITKRGICIDKEMINFGYKPPEILFQCGVGRGLIEEEKAGSGIKSYDCSVLSKVIEIGKEPDFWLSVNGQPCLIEIKVDKSLNGLIFGYQGREEDCIAKLLACAELPNSHKENCMQRCNSQKQDEKGKRQKQNETNRIQDKLRQDIKSICGSYMTKKGEKETEGKEGKNKAIDGSIYDIFKWIKHIDKIEASLSLAFLLDFRKRKSIYTCLSNIEKCRKFSNVNLNALEKWRQMLNEWLGINRNYHFTMAIYGSLINGVKLSKTTITKDIPLILFMAETRYKPNNQPSNQTQGGSV